MAIRKRGSSFVADYYDADGKRRWKTFTLEREARAFEVSTPTEI
jgi:hypothetical protein